MLNRSPEDSMQVCLVDKTFQFVLHINATHVSLFEKIFPAGHSSDMDQKQSGILLTTKDHKENGTESLTS